MNRLGRFKLSYESRRAALKVSRLLKVLVFYQMLKDTSPRGLLRALDESAGAQRALGGDSALNTFSNALKQRDLGRMIEAWALLFEHYPPHLARLGKKFARIAAAEASLIKLSLAAFNGATYCEKTGATKITCFEWVKDAPQQFVFTAFGKIHGLKATAQISWSAGWTYLFDRGYFSFDLLTTLLNVGVHFVIRLKQGVEYRIIERYPIPDLKSPAGLGGHHQ